MLARDHHVVYPSTSVARGQIVAQVLWTLLLLTTFEGAIRKWVWPGGTLPLMALRDLLVALIIVWGVYKGWYQWHSPVEKLLAIWSFAVIAWGFLQMILALQPPVIGLLGLRSWLLYLWFALLCARTLERRDVEDILLRFSYLVIPMALLATAQHFSSPLDVLNRQADGDDIPLVAGDIVRVTGTFSHTHGYGVFIGLMSPVVMALAAGEFSRLRSGMLRWTIVATFFVAVMVSGSRTCFFEAAFAAAGLVFALLIRRGGGGKRLIAICVMGGAIGMALPLIFPSALESIESRFETAAEAEVLQERVSWMFIGDPTKWPSMDLFGAGIGVGNNAAGPLMGGRREFLLSETETERMLMEAGVLGVMFVLLKAVIAALGLLASLRMVRMRGVFLPWLLWLFVGIELLAGQITAQLTAHAIGWLTLGLALASLNEPKTNSGGSTAHRQHMTVRASAMTLPFRRQTR